MNTSILITDGGPHSPEVWAECTASHILQIGEHVAGERLAGARKLESAIIDILEGHHTTVQEGERAQLKANNAPVDNTVTPFSPEEHICIADIIQQICDAAKGTEWESHFADPVVQAYIDEVLRQHFATNIDIERQWHLDRLVAEAK